jgi:hypothetical protein
MKKLILTVFVFFLTGCSFTSDINEYKVEYKGYSNFTINQSEIFPYEELFITVNDKFIYYYGNQKIPYWNMHYYKLPETATKIEVKSVYQNKIILNKIIFDTVNTSKEIFISVPYPKKFKNKKFIFPPKWGPLRIEESERDIRLIHY